MEFSYGNFNENMQDFPDFLNLNEISNTNDYKALLLYLLLSAFAIKVINNIYFKFYK